MNVDAILAHSRDGGGGARPGQTPPGEDPHRFIPRLHATAAILAGQAVLGGLAGAAAWAVAGAAAADAAWLGAVVAMANLLHMGLRLKSAAAGARQAPLYLGAAERFLFTALAFAMAITRLHLPFLPLLAGFASAQFGHLAGARPQCDPA